MAQQTADLEPDPSDVLVVGFYFTRDEWESLSEGDRMLVLAAPVLPGDRPRGPSLTSKVGDGERARRS